MWGKVSQQIPYGGDPYINIWDVKSKTDTTNNTETNIWSTENNG